MTADKPLCADCFAEWERVLEPGQQPPQMFRIHHIGNVSGADLSRAALQRADEYWARVRAYQDHIARKCRAEHAPAPSPRRVVDLPLPEPLKEGAAA